MHRTQHRFLSILAASTVALSLSAAPALAGSDGCSDGGCQAENAPATVVPAVPTPAAPAPLQASQGTSGGDTAPETASKSKSKSRATQTRTVAVAQQRTVPQGAVAAGAGGTAPDGSDGVVFGLAGAALVMMAAGGRLVVAARRS
jgi:hypothetical protein